VNVASLGVSGRVVELVKRSPRALGGRGSFLLGALRAIARHRPQPVSLAKGNLLELTFGYEPRLRVERTQSADSIRISWPASAKGFILEKSGTLSAEAGAWSAVSARFEQNDQWLSLNATPQVAPRFYRLKYPHP
jgi:hypothetical protein